MGAMTELNDRWGSNVKVTLPDHLTNARLPHADMKPLYRTDYDTHDNPESPEYTLPHVELERVFLDDITQLQMFEKRVSMNREIRAYKCHIASVKNYTQHAKHDDNIVFASWLFHQYFDGLMTEDNIPLLIVRPEQSYEDTEFGSKRRREKRQKVQVLIDFTTPDGLLEILPTLREGCQQLSPTQLRTHLYAIDETNVRVFQAEVPRDCSALEKEKDSCTTT
jgi:hypothetical protein